MGTLGIIFSGIGLLLCAIVAGFAGVVIFGIVCAMFKKNIELEDLDKWEEEK